MKKILFILSIFTAIFFISAAVSYVSKKNASVTIEVKDELSDQPLVVTGEIPNWLNGTLVRNGPIRFSIQGQGDSGHFFDGLAMLHAFSICEGKVFHSNRFLRTDSHRAVFEEGVLPYAGFARDPCRSIFRSFFTWFHNKSGPPLVNANVNVAKIMDQYVALTETPLPVQFDLKTLDTLGVLNYQDELPKEKCWESAHPCYDYDAKETINYLIKYGQVSTYTIYRIKDGSNSREIIAEIPVDEPAYMHSFAITKNYVIFTEFPFVVKPLDLIKKGKAFISNFYWDPERGTQFIVVNRHTGDVLGKYKTRPFFAFHHVNAYEEGSNIHLDIVCYDDAGVIMDIAKPTKKKGNEHLERFTISLKTDEITNEMILQSACELPRINELMRGHKYHYVYLTDFTTKPKAESQRPLYKVDTQTKDVIVWSEPGCYPGEPQFVPQFNAKDEDSGVVLAVVIDLKKKCSFLLVLDAKSFQEIGRAYVPQMMTVGLHNQFFEKP